MRPRLEVFRDLRELAERAAEVFAGQMSFASRERGRVSVALSRPTPREVFERIDEVGLPARDVDLFQVDERRAPPGSDDRNLTLIERHLTSWAAQATIHPMPVHVRPPSHGARSYASELESVCGRPPVLDLVHLGLGPDGHTASLLPRDPALAVTDEWVVHTRKRAGFGRSTMTYPVLAVARLVVFIVTGEAKADALARVLSRDPAMPASNVGAADQLFLVDAGAAGKLPS